MENLKKLFQKQFTWMRPFISNIHYEQIIRWSIISISRSCRSLNKLFYKSNTELNIFKSNSKSEVMWDIHNFNRNIVYIQINTYRQRPAHSTGALASPGLELFPWSLLHHPKRADNAKWVRKRQRVPLLFFLTVSSKLKQNDISS